MMNVFNVAILYSIFLMEQHSCIHFIDIIPVQNTENSSTLTKVDDIGRRNYPSVQTSTEMDSIRRHFLDAQNARVLRAQSGYGDEKDSNLKYKISTLVQQTIHDTERRVKSIQYIKDKHRQELPYKAGFILSMIKKARDILNELFNVAVKHKDEWKALEQLKIFELIVHTNVDTTNLVRQLVEIHIQYLNTTSKDVNSVRRKRVVLLN